MGIERATTITTPLGGADVLTFTHLSGRDEISRCFTYRVGMVSGNADVDPLSMLGGSIAVEGEAEPERWFNGIISAFRLTRIEDRRAYYEATVRPWLWFLSNTYDCCIFQNMTAVDIIEKIFSKYPNSKVEKRLQSSYPTREYCVQYDETDLDFVQRLMEHEGIFYFFEHSESEHKLILVDQMSKLKPAPKYETVHYNDEGEATRRDAEYINDWIPGSSVEPGSYAHTDYDFEKPGADLMAKSEHPFGHKQASGENYRHPGAHIDVGRGDAIALLRREEIQAPHRHISAVGTVRGLFSGCTFKLDNFPRDDQNQEYLVVSAEYRLLDPGFATDVATDGENFKVVLGLAPTSIPFRPARITPRPIMRGPQTATVVGPSGEEIFTDKYARVKVQFHWDRKGKKDQNSSCFVRVSQTWAGSGWGFIQIPRIGQEVIVDFIEGDPDLPIITGRVYNASQMPPYGLPGEATKSGWKSNSSKGGGGYNELMFEDKAGSELVNFQAQKDHKLLIKHNRTKHVGNDQSDRIDHDAKHSVGHDLTEEVFHDKSTTVHNNRTVHIMANDTETVDLNRSLTVNANETIHVVANSTENIDANHSQTVGVVQTITVGAARVDTVGAAETRTVGAAQVNTIGASRAVSVGVSQAHDIGAADSWNVGADQSITIGANQSMTIGSNQSFSVGAARTADISKDDSTTIGGAHSLSVEKDSSVGIKGSNNIKIDKKLVIDVGDEILIKTGSAKLMMKKDGTIAIEGKDISVKASGSISIKASSDITMKGSKIGEN